MIPVRPSAGRPARRSLAVAALALVPLALGIGSEARAITATELGVKAAFLYKFSGYVEWPASALPSPTSPIVFGVMGDDRMAAELHRLMRVRSDAARPIVVQRLRAFDSIPPVHVLFVGRGEADRLASIVRALGDQPVLVVTDVDGGLARGAAINFMVVRGRVKFDVDLPAAQRRGLVLSARLLAVAQTIQRSPGD